MEATRLTSFHSVATAFISVADRRSFARLELVVKPAPAFSFR